MIRFIKKRKMDVCKPQKVVIMAESYPSENKTEIKEKPKKPSEAKPKIKKEKTETNMVTVEQIAAAEKAAENMKPEVKVVKKDRGLIERTESSKIILTEDNRQVLND